MFVLLIIWWLFLLFVKFKWDEIFRKITSKSRLERVCRFRRDPIAIERALYRDDVLAPVVAKLNSSSPFDVIELEKEIIVLRNVKTKSTYFVKFVHPQLCHTLNHLRRVVVVHSITESLRDTPYSTSNKKHERMLMELWNGFRPYPAHPQLEDRISNRWKELGFQGKDPATDFRGSGVLALYCLVWMTRKSPISAREIESRSLPIGGNGRSVSEFPIALVGIQCAMLTFSLLEKRVVNYVWFMLPQKSEASDVSMFFCVFTEVFVRFAVFWELNRPPNLMHFPKVFDKFERCIWNLAIEKKLGKAFLVVVRKSNDPETPLVSDSETR